MASLRVVLHGCAARSRSTPWPTTPAVPGFHRPSGGPKLNPNSLVLSTRIKGALRYQTRQKQLVAYASNSNPSGGDSVEKKSGEKASDAAKGPPFLTILAGLLVFGVVFWVIGSVLIWLVSLISNLPPK